MDFYYAGDFITNISTEFRSLRNQNFYVIIYFKFSVEMMVRLDYIFSIRRVGCFILVDVEHFDIFGAI